MTCLQCGLPAMSSVSGCVLVVIPGVAGLALWSPSLDRFRNSRRAVAFCQELVRRYTLHRFGGIGVRREHLRLPTKNKVGSSPTTDSRQLQYQNLQNYGY